MGRAPVHRNAGRVEWEGGAEADQLVTKWAELPDEGKLADLIHEATLAQIDPSKPYVQGDDKAKYMMIKGQFTALSSDAKKVYTDLQSAPRQGAPCHQGAH